MEAHEPLPIKVVGRKKLAQGLEAANRLQKTMIAMRAGLPFIPKGVHRFKTFEEAQQWSIKMMARPSVGHPI